MAGGGLAPQHYACAAPCGDVREGWNGEQQLRANRWLRPGPQAGSAAGVARRAPAARCASNRLHPPAPPRPRLAPPAPLQPAHTAAAAAALAARTPPGPLHQAHPLHVGPHHHDVSPRFSCCGLACALRHLGLLHDAVAARPSCAQPTCCTAQLLARLRRPATLRPRPASGVHACACRQPCRHGRPHSLTHPAPSPASPCAVPSSCSPWRASWCWPAATGACCPSWKRCGTRHGLLRSPPPHPTPHTPHTHHTR